MHLFSSRGILQHISVVSTIVAAPTVKGGYKPYKSSQWNQNQCAIARVDEGRENAEESGTRGSTIGEWLFVFIDAAYNSCRLRNLMAKT
jgi:hypothetical protein